MSWKRNRRRKERRIHNEIVRNLLSRGKPKMVEVRWAENTRPVEVYSEVIESIKRGFIIIDDPLKPGEKVDPEIAKKWLEKINKPATLKKEDWRE
jgi:hypothetical protein